MPFLKSLPLVFYSRAFYRDLAQQKEGRARPYIFSTAGLLILTAFFGAGGLAQGLREAIQKLGELSGLMQVVVGVGDVGAAAVWGSLTETFTGGGSILLVLALLLVALGMIVLLSALAAVFSALVASLLSLVLGASIDFQAALRLAAAALLPATLATVLPLGIDARLIWLGYLIFAVWSCRVAGSKSA